MGRSGGAGEGQVIQLNLQVPERPSKEKRSIPTRLPYGPANGFNGFRAMSCPTVSEAGERVDERSALNIATVFSCVKILSESVAAFPFRLYRKTKLGREEATDDHLHQLLTSEPNSEMSAFTFFEVLVKGLLLAGNCYAEIRRDEDGNVIGLWPLEPRLTYPARLSDGSLYYLTADGEQPGYLRSLPSRDMLHVVFFPGWDGLSGLSPLRVAMGTFGAAMAADKFAARVFRNDATPSIAIQLDGEVDAKTKFEMRQEWELLQAGANQHRVAILDSGMKVERLGLAPDECQFLETRKFLREEICGIYGVPAFRVGSSERLSQNSAEQMSLSFLIDTLKPIAIRITAELERKLLPRAPGTPATRLIEADMRDRLKGDLAASTAYYSTAINTGWMSPNEARREVGLNEGPEALNAFRYPVNQQNVERLVEGAHITNAEPS